MSERERISAKAWIDLNLTSLETPEQISHRLSSCTNPLLTHIMKGKKGEKQQVMQQNTVNDLPQKQRGLSDHICA